MPPTVMTPPWLVPPVGLCVVLVPPAGAAAPLPLEVVFVPELAFPPEALWVAGAALLAGAELPAGAALLTGAAPLPGAGAGGADGPEEEGATLLGAAAVPASGDAVGAAV